jgi:hypothetical protein
VQILLRPKKNICLFTVTRPTLFSVATLVHFIGKSKVKVDTSEIFGLKKIFSVASWKIIGINFFIIQPQQFFWGIITPSHRRAIKYILKSGTFSGYGWSAIWNFHMWNKMEIRSTYPIFLEDVTVNRHIFFLSYRKVYILIYSAPSVYHPPFYRQPRLSPKLSSVPISPIKKYTVILPNSATAIRHRFSDTKVVKPI